MMEDNKGLSRLPNGSDRFGEREIENLGKELERIEDVES